METKKIIVLLVTILLIIIIGFYINYINKKNKENLELLEKRRRNEELKREELKENNPEEYKRLLNDDEERKKKNKLWKDTRVGVFIFMGIHLFIEILFSEGIGTGQPNPGVTVGFNYVISRYFIKRSIFKKNKIIDKPILYGIGISLIVFCFRFLLGVISYFLII